MLFGKKSLGLEISPAGLSLVLLQGSRARPRLEKAASLPLGAGVLKVSLREANVLDKDAFLDGLRSLHSQLEARDQKLSVALPDAIGRVMLLDMEERFKSRADGLDMIRWKLKKNLPFDLEDTMLDYQRLTTRNDGSQSLLVTMASRRVLYQYEDLLVEAGFHISGIDLNTFNICRAFEADLALLENGALISCYGDSLGIIIFSEGLPLFLRFKYLPQAADNYNRVFTEVSSSLLVFREKYPEAGIPKVNYVAPPEIAAGFSQMLEEIVDQKPLGLNVGAALKASGNVTGEQGALFPYTAAIGAAMRNL